MTKPDTSTSDDTVRAENVQLRRKVKAMRNELRNLNKANAKHIRLWTAVQNSNSDRSVCNWRAVEAMREQRDALIRIILESPEAALAFVKANYDTGPKPIRLWGLWRKK